MDAEIEGREKTCHSRHCCGALGRTWRVWVFLSTGLLQIVCSFLIAVVYFSVRSLTTSLQHIETVPTYANAILVMCTGILVIVLCKRRDPVLLVANTVINLVCCVLCATCCLLTALRPLLTIKRFSSCRYDGTYSKCFCSLQQVANKALDQTALQYMFNGAPSCDAITSNVYDFLVALCMLYAVTVVLSSVALANVLYLIHAYQHSLRDSDMREALPCNMEPSPTEGENPSFILLHRGLTSDSSDILSALPLPLFPRMTLPGLQEGASQSLGLSGNSQARLLGVRRCNSLDSVPGLNRQPDLSQWHLWREDGLGEAYRQPNPARGRRATARPRQSTSDNRNTDVRRTYHRNRRNPTSYPPRIQRIPSQQQQQRRGTALETRSSCYNSTNQENERHERMMTTTVPPPPRRTRSRRARARRVASTPPAPPPRHLPSHMAYLHLMGLSGLPWPAARGSSLPWIYDPPPPYCPSQLPPYMEHDPAPSYHSRMSSPQHSLLNFRL